MKLFHLPCLAFLAAVSTAEAQSNHSQVFFDSSGTDQAAFAENRIVTISGNVTYYGRSSPLPVGGGTVDFVQPATDVYIVPHGLYHGTGGVNLQLPLVDVAGAPNTVLGLGGGGFFEEPIATTYPQGSLVSGEYDVVLDEHQNRKFDLLYDLYLGVGQPTLTIAIPLNAPSLPGTGIAAMKLRAINQYQSTQVLSAGFKVIQDMYDGPKSHLVDVLAEASLGGGASGLNFKQLMIRELVLVGWYLLQDYLDIGSHGDFLKQPLQAAQNALENAGTHATGIAADPPDANFAVTVTLPARQPDAASNENAFLGAVARMAAVVDDEQRVSGALLASLEKYQGADVAGNGCWALAHAREVKHYAALLAAQWLAEADAIAQVRTTLNAFPVNLDVLGTAYTLLQEDVRTGGLTPADRQMLADSGLSGDRLARAQEKFLAEDFGFSKAATLSGLDAKVAANTAGAPGLTQ